MTARLLIIALLSAGLVGCSGGGSDSTGTNAVEEEPNEPLDVSDANVDTRREAVSHAERTERYDPEPEIELTGSMRKWKNPDGDVLAIGEFVSLMNGRVCLEEPTGGGATIAVDDLSAEDQKYIESLGEVDLAAAEEEPFDLEAPFPEATTKTDPTPDYANPRRRKVVIPFDFVSNFDKGDYGSRIGDMVWKKIQREGGFLLPDSMVDVRDFCDQNKITIEPNTPLEEIGRILRDEFDADIGVWGQVERVPPNEWEVYDLTIKCVDFSSAEPKMLYEVTARTNSVSEIPHLYVKQMLDKLYDRTPGGSPPVDQLAEENWEKNPGLLDGDFEEGRSGVPSGWSARGGHYREPLGNQVKWIAEAGNSDNRVVRFEFPESVGNSEGVSYYSDWFNVDEGAKYRFQCRYRTNGPKLIVFIKCYDSMGSEYNVEGKAPMPASSRSGNQYVPEESQRRECYRSQQNLKGAKNTWHTHTEDFTPKHTKYSPKWGRIMLYAYLGAGVVEWDDVIIKQIVPASPGESIKDPRHSMESTVTIREMQEDEARVHEPEEPKQKSGTGSEP